MHALYIRMHWDAFTQTYAKHEIDAKFVRSALIYLPLFSFRLSILIEKGESKEYDDEKVKEKGSSIYLK